MFSACCCYRHCVMPTHLQVQNSAFCNSNSAGFYHPARSTGLERFAPCIQARSSPGSRDGSALQDRGVHGHRTTSSGSSNVLPAACTNPSVLPQTPWVFISAEELMLYSKSKGAPACREDWYGRATACPHVPPSALDATEHPQWWSLMLCGTSQDAPPAMQHSASSRSSPATKEKFSDQSQAISRTPVRLRCCRTPSAASHGLCQDEN